MNKLVISAVALAAAVGAPAALAHEGDNGMKDAPACARSGVGPSAAVDTAQPDRFYVCVSDGSSANGAEAYVGMEAVSENPPGDTPMCGGAEVAGQREVAGEELGNPDWNTDHETNHCE